MKKGEANLMQWAFQAADRCGAKTRRATPCQAPAMPNGRCRMHGGKSPGAPCGQANGSYRTGNWTKEAIASRKQVNDLIRQSRALLQQI
jgi:hypothetical protein